MPPSQINVEADVMVYTSDRERVEDALAKSGLYGMITDGDQTFLVSIVRRGIGGERMPTLAVHFERP